VVDHLVIGNLVHRRQYSALITLTDGTVIKYHPLFKFADDQFHKFKPEDKQNLFEDRAKYKRAKEARSISALQPYYPMPPYHMTQYAPYPAIVNVNHQISQVGQIISAALPPQPGPIHTQIPFIPPPPPPQSDASTWIRHEGM